MVDVICLHKWRVSGDVFRVTCFGCRWTFRGMFKFSSMKALVRFVWEYVFRVCIITSGWLGTSCPGSIQSLGGSTAQWRAVFPITLLDTKAVECWSQWASVEMGECWSERVNKFEASEWESVEVQRASVEIIQREELLHDDWMLFGRKFRVHARSETWCLVYSLFKKWQGEGVPFQIAEWVLKSECWSQSVEVGALTAREESR